MKNIAIRERFRVPDRGRLAVPAAGGLTMLLAGTVLVAPTRPLPVARVVIPET
jgi:hypothetical protein